MNNSPETGLQKKKPITSFSFNKLFWLESKGNRISFRLDGIPKDIHFTISWENSEKVNLHITKNIGDGTDKPKIVIIEINKSLVAEIVGFIPQLIINQLYKPLSFKGLSRASRKNIRLFYFDNIESHPQIKVLEDKILNLFKENSSVKKGKLKVTFNREKELLCHMTSDEMRAFLLNNLRKLSRDSFGSKELKAGIIIMGNNISQFLCSNGRCYKLRKKLTLQGILSSFMKPELSKSIIQLITDSVVRLKDAQTYLDTEPFNRPYQLYLENATSN
jgi:hypothetical protein